MVSTRKAEAHVQLKPGIIGVRVKIMPPDAYFPDRITVATVFPEEEKVTVPAPQPVAAPGAPKPAEPQAQVVAEKAPEPEVKATEVIDQPKTEEKKE